MSSLRKISMQEVASHKSAQSCWVVIHDKVYDVTKFLEEHPGGEEVLLEQAGNYATDAFEDIGHSTDARELMGKYLIGEIVEKETKAAPATAQKGNKTAASGMSSWIGFLIPVCVAVGAFLLYKFSG